MRGLFVTGTDTGVGKTCVSAGLLALLSRQGWRAAGFKPVAAGLTMRPDGTSSESEDVTALLAASSPGQDPAQVGPFQLREACAPHIAAALEGRRLPREGWLARAQALQAEWVVAEGAGGFCVPLSAPGDLPRWGLDDVATDLGWPVVLVVGLRLGCLNHALLTAQAIAARGLTLAGWVCSRIDPTMPHAEANLASLRAWLPAPCWGDVPWLPAAPTPAQVADRLDLPAIRAALSC